MAATFLPSTGHGRLKGRSDERVSGSIPLRDLSLRRALSARVFISGSGSARTRRRRCAQHGPWYLKGRLRMFTIEFIRIRAADNAHATLDRVLQAAADLEAVKVRAKSLFHTLDLPQDPDGLRILDEGGRELFVWAPGDDKPSAQGDLC
jgi:hypothetical protein